MLQIQNSQMTFYLSFTEQTYMKKAALIFILLLPSLLMAQLINSVTENFL